MTGIQAGVISGVGGLQVILYIALDSIQISQLSGLVPFQLSLRQQLCSSHTHTHSVLPYHSPKSHRTNPLWTETSRAISQSQLFMC